MEAAAWSRERAESAILGASYIVIYKDSSPGLSINFSSDGIIPVEWSDYSSICLIDQKDISDLFINLDKYYIEKGYIPVCSPSKMSDSSPFPLRLVRWDDQSFAIFNGYCRPIESIEGICTITKYDIK